MAKKNRKKNRRSAAVNRPAQPAKMIGSESVERIATDDLVRPTESTSKVVAADDPAFDYVKRDIRKIAWLALGFVVVLLVGSYLFDHTGIGARVYGLIKVQ